MAARSKEGYREISCRRCSYKWMSRTVPKRCPQCRTTLWNVPPNPINRCIQCGHEWSSNTADPKKCPSCQSQKWNRATSRHECRRCGHEWKGRFEERPKRCPSCHSVKWDEDLSIQTCPECGHVKEMRSNSRDSMCPICDIRSQRCSCKECGHSWKAARSRDPRKCPKCGSRKWNGQYSEPGANTTVTVRHSDVLRKASELNISYADAREMMMRSVK